MFKDYTLQTTWGRALVALAVGAVVGLFLEILLGSVLSAMDGFQNPMQLVSSAWREFITLFPFALAAMFLIGAPVLALCHRMQLRTWLSAATVGFAIPSILFFSIFILVIAGCFGSNPSQSSFGAPLSEWLMTVWYSILFGVIGALTALIIWRIAYRRPTPC